MHGDFIGRCYERLTNKLEHFHRILQLYILFSKSFIFIEKINDS